jgi:Na+/proline symporter
MISLKLDPSFWWLLAGYGALLVGVSLYFTRMIKNSDDFYGAGGRTSFWFSGLSFFMTAFSASVFVANASFAYRRGGLNALLILAQLPVFIAGYRLFAARWRSTGCATVVGFIGQRFGQGTAKFFMWVGLPVRVLESANRLYVTAVLFEVMLGISLLSGAGVTAVVTLLSTVGGGFLAVVVTDAVQAILLTLIVAMVAALSWVAVCGWEGFSAGVPADYWTLATDISGFGVPLITAWAAVALFAWNGNWSLVQRFVSVPGVRDAKRVSVVSGISYYLLFPLIAVPAMAAAVLVPGLNTPQQAEYAYILVAQKVLPGGLMAMLCFGLLGATVTAINADLNVMAQVVVNDMLKKTLMNSTERRRLFLGRAIMVMVSALCLVLAMRIRDFGGAFQFLLTVLGMTTLPTFMPLLAGLLWPRGTGRSAMTAFAAGIIVSIILKFFCGASLATVIICNGTLTALVYFISGRLERRPDDDEARVAALFERMRNPRLETDDPALHGSDEQGRGVARVAAITIVLCGVLALCAELLTGAGSAGRGMAGLIAGMLFAIGGTIFYLNRKRKTVL